MTQSRILVLILCAIAFVLSGIGQSGVQAQSLGISPAFFDATVKRGATYNKAYTVLNNTDTRLRVHFSVSDYWYDEHNARVDGRPGSLPHSASLWVQFAPTEVIIEAHGTGIVHAVISVPQTAAGGYYSSPIIEAEAASNPINLSPKNTVLSASPALTASISLRFRGLMMLTTEGATEYNVEVMGGTATPPTGSAPLEMQLDIRNRSTAHARIRAVFAILDASGKLAGRGKIEEKRYLPGQRDTLKAAWGGELPLGRYTAIVTLSYDRAAMEPATLVYEMPFEVK